MDTQRRRLPAALQFIAVAAALAGVLSAIYIGFFSWLVLTADDFPQSSELHPDKALMFWLALSACALGLASLWAATTRRPWMALAAVGIEALVTFATRSTTRSGGSSPRCAHSRWKSRWDLLPAPIDPDQGRAEATPVSF